VKTHSLRIRLIATFCLLLVLAWVISTGISYIKTRHRIRFIFDAQQLIAAQQIENFELQELQAAIPLSNRLLKLKNAYFKKADRTLSFAIYDLNGKTLLTDRPDEAALRFDPTKINSLSTPQFYDINDWRTLWYKTTDNQVIIIVAQSNSYRDALTHSIILDHQVMPWLIIIPFLMLAIIYIINREMKPIKQVTRSLQHRLPDDRTPLPDKKIPSEIQPLIHELNTLFERISTTIEWERRFVSNAAHELRSPLAALQVQTDVAKISINKPETQQKALDNLTTSITRASRLIDQLLTLSKLDSFSGLPNNETLDWNTLIQTRLNEFESLIAEKRLVIYFDQQATPKPVNGDPLLLSLLLRNLIDNAVRYTSVGGKITLQTTTNSLTLTNMMQPVEPDELAKIGQRFYRPPGQEQTGSGLGLSIAEQIAELHQLTFTFGCKNANTFYTKLQF